jgi:hypothetical protein
MLSALAGIEISEEEGVMRLTSSSTAGESVLVYKFERNVDLRPVSTWMNQIVLKEQWKR